MQLSELLFSIDTKTGPEQGISVLWSASSAATELPFRWFISGCSSDVLFGELTLRSTSQTAVGALSVVLYNSTVNRLPRFL